MKIDGLSLKTTDSTVNVIAHTATFARKDCQKVIFRAILCWKSVKVKAQGSFFHGAQGAMTDGRSKTRSRAKLRLTDRRG